MRRRANRVVAGIAAGMALAVVSAVIVVQPTKAVPGIVVPALDAPEAPVPRAAKSASVTETGGVAGTFVVPDQQQSATRRQATRPTGATPESPAPPAASQPPVPTTGNPPPATTPRFSPSAYYGIVNHVNALVLDSGGPVRPATPMKLWERGPSPNLQFQLLETDSGYYRLVNRANGFAVDGRGARDTGAYVGQWTWNGSPKQQWLPIDTGNGLFLLRNRETGLVLDGGGPGVRFGAHAKQWPANGSPNLLWRLEIV